MVEIVNECTKLPPLFRYHLRLCLDWISRVDLAGIGTIRFAENIPISEMGFNEELKSIHLGHGPVEAAYTKATGSAPAVITIVPEAVYRPIPFPVYLSPMPVIVIGRILAHEVAHHLVATRGFIYAPDEKYPSFNVNPAFEEEMANRYAFRVVRRMQEKVALQIRTLSDEFCI